MEKVLICVSVVFSVIYVVIALVLMCDAQNKDVYDSKGYIKRTDKIKLTDAMIVRAFSWPLKMIVRMFGGVMLIVGPVLWLRRTEDYRDSTFKKRIDKFME